MFTHKGYKASPTIDPDANVIRGRVLEINDVVTFEGKTVEEARQEFIRSVDLYLEFCRQEKIEPEKPFSGRLPFRTSPEIHRLIYRAATQAGKSINAWMEDVLGEAARNHPKRSADGDQTSPSLLVHAFIEEPAGIARLVQTVSPFLKRDSTGSLLSALEKLLIGLEAVLPLLNEEPNALSKTVSAIDTLLETAPKPVPPGTHPEVEQQPTYRQ